MRIARLIKKHLRFPCLVWTIQFCIVCFAVMTPISQACGGGGGGGWWTPRKKFKGPQYNATNETLPSVDLDEALVVNLTGIKDPVDRNIKTAWRGWEPDDSVKKDWKKWHEEYLKENAKKGEGPWKLKKKKKGQSDDDDGTDGSGGAGGAGGAGGTGPGGDPFGKERGPGSGWPKIPGWQGLGEGIDGTPVPPWGYEPKNVGKPTICLLPPVRGTCRGPNKDKKPEKRWGYNPYKDDCEQYEWSGCGGTRNKFTAYDKCIAHCMSTPPPSCAADSGIKESNPNKARDLNK